MENDLEPIYEAYDRLKLAQLDGDTKKEKEIQNEISILRKKVVEESKWKGSSTFFQHKAQINFEKLKGGK